jgi:hypothetical protein
MAGRHADGLWLPIAVPTGTGQIQTGEPCVSLQVAQRQARNALN